MKRDRSTYHQQYQKNNKLNICKYQKQYRQDHKADMSKYQKQYYQDNKVAKQQYYQQNKNVISAYQKQRRSNQCFKVAVSIYTKTRHKNNIQFHLGHNLRNRLNKALGGHYKIGSAVRDLGCTIDEFKTYIENQFQHGMSWNNWARKGWHIDHIKPLASFDLTIRKQFLAATHYTNLQPLWWYDNLQKSATTI